MGGTATDALEVAAGQLVEMRPGKLLDHIARWSKSETPMLDSILHA
jgi:hypothetical protein